MIRVHRAEGIFLNIQSFIFYTETCSSCFWVQNCAVAVTCTDRAKYVCLIKRPNDIRADRGFTRSIHPVILIRFQGFCQLTMGLKGLVLHDSQVLGDKHIFMTHTLLQGIFPLERGLWYFRVCKIKVSV